MGMRRMRRSRSCRAATTRLAATTLSRAYAEGLPVARQIQLTADLGGDLGSTIEKMRDAIDLPSERSEP
jgi:hypothetical protein